MSDAVITEEDGGVLVITINRPQAKNAVNADVAMEIALTGDCYTAERMAELGFINRLAQPGEALAEAKILAAKIAENAPLALAATKKIIVGSTQWPADELWDRQNAIMGPVFGSKDAQEGPAAFAQKRKPVWTGE